VLSKAKVLRQKQFDGGRSVARGRELEVEARTMQVEAVVLRQRQFDGGRSVARGRELEVEARTRQGGGRSVEARWRQKC